MNLKQLPMKLVLVLLGSLVLVYMAKSVFVDPRLSNYNEEIETYNQAATVINARVNAANKVKAEQDEYGQRLEKVTRSMPGEPDIDRAISSLRGAFAAADVTWVAFNPQPLPAAAPVTAPPTTTAQERSHEAKAATVTVPTTVPRADTAPRAIKASISIRGGTNNIHAALDGLKELDRLVVVDSVVLTIEGDLTRAVLEARLFVFDLPEPEPLPDPSASTVAVLPAA